MNKKNKKLRLTGGILIVFFLFLLISPSLQADDVCAEALKKCGFQAVVAGLFSGGVLAVKLSSCILGYTWCLKYYV